MKRRAKTKARRKTTRAPPPSAPFIVSDRVLAAADLLVSGKDCGPDARIVELFLAWSSVRMLDDVLLDHSAYFGRRTHAEGRDEGDCPTLCAIRRLQDILFPHRRALMETLASIPAQTPRGLALKLLVYRWESCHRTDGALSDVEDIPAYAAYRDALQLADLVRLSHPTDELTDALLSTRKAVEIDDD